MNLSFKRVLKISRPRFWIYEFGTFVLGMITAASFGKDLLSLESLIFALYFLIPANILIYGINDIYDYETDKLNPKKEDYEDLVKPESHKSLYRWIVLSNIPFIILLLWLNVRGGVFFLAFLFFAIFYSAKPIRAKNKPIIDSIFSASHYVATAVFGYFLIGGETFPILGVLAGLLWAVAMHAYSAVPDIEADKNAGVSTMATLFGKKGTIFLCLILFLVAGYIGSLKLGYIVFIYGFVYAFIMLLSLKRVNNPKALFGLYRIFPAVNFVGGAVITISAILANPSLFPGL